MVKDNTLRAKVTDYFLSAAVGVCEGQQMDMDFETRDDVELPEYMEMIRLKTAVLLAEGMTMGAALAGANETQIEGIRKFGNLIGTAFQIQDDILDTYGDPSKFGKKVGGDIAQNKKTFLYLRALELAEGDTKNDLLHHYSDASELEEREKIAKVTALFDGLGIKSQAEAEKSRLAEKAFRALDQAGIPSDRLATLKVFVRQLADRET